MAFASSVDFQRPPSQLSVDRKPTFFNDEFDAEDSSFMDNSTMISPAEDRRDSFGNSAGPVFSPQETWDGFGPNATMGERLFTHSGNNFIEPQSNNPFRQDPAQFQNQHNSQWPPFDHASEPRASMISSTYEPYGSEFDTISAQGFSSNGAFGPMAPHVRPATVFGQPTPMSQSPTPPKDWMGLAESGQMDSRLPKRLRGQSPPRFSQNFRSGDGIRKKNARFEIPQERNLNNIDRMIDECKDDDEKKELKQQKRLLRNRQAALDSRQRKKARAEELEVENKKLADQLGILSDDLQQLKIEFDASDRHKSELMSENAQLHDRLQQSDWDKENLVVEHTKETSDLRKKIQVLQEMLEAREQSDSTRPVSNDYDFPITTEMSGLGLDMHEWADDAFADFVMDSDTKPIETSLVLAPKKKIEHEKADESGPSGLLMLLLLCGAWVASKAQTSMPVTIPRMPEEVRSDAAVVFDDLMKDHGVATFQAAGALASNDPNAGNVQMMSFPMPGSATTSHLDNMHSQITRPSKRQEAEAAFSLSAKQYNSLTSANFADAPYNTPPEDDSNGSPSHRRHLVDTLRAMREDVKGQSTPTVYTRSLLWDRIPDDVVQQFRRMAEQTSRAASVDADGGGGE